MLSVITACFNSEKTISRTIESVLSQTDTNIEHVFKDGGSTDETLFIIDSYRLAYEEKGIRLTVISSPDKGIYDGMNQGIESAVGDVIGILNSDDWYEQDTAGIINTLVKENPDSSIFMGAINIHNGNQIIVKHARDRKYKTSRDFNHPAMFARRSAYERVGLYESGNVHNDYGWYLKAVKMGEKVYIIPDVLANFVIGGESSRKSLRNTLKRIEPKYEVYKRNGYSRLYWFECVGQELAKYLLVKDE